MNNGEVIAESAVRFVRDFDAPPKRVWAFLTQTSLLPEWYGEGEIEPREGGRISLMLGHIRGVVTSWQAEKFLAYSWSVFQPNEEVSAWPMSYVELSLDKKVEATQLTLTHRPIPGPMQNLTMIGWHTMLDLIASGLAGAFPSRTDIMPRNAALYGIDLNALTR